MNSIAIVDDFAQTVSHDEERVKARMAQLIQETVGASATVSVPRGTGIDPYSRLAGDFQATTLDMGIDPEMPIADRLSAAAEFLFNSYD